MPGSIVERSICLRIILVEDNSVLGDVLRLWLDTHVGGQLGGRGLYQRIPARQGPGTCSDHRIQRFQHRLNSAQASVSARTDHTRGTTSSEQGRVSNSLISFFFFSYL